MTLAVKEVHAVPDVGRLVTLMKAIDKVKPQYVVTLTFPYHPRLAYLLNDTRKNEKTQLKSLIEFFSSLPRGYGGTDSVKMDVKEISNVTN